LWPDATVLDVAEAARTLHRLADVLLAQTTDAGPPAPAPRHLPSTKAEPWTVVRVGNLEIDVPEHRVRVDGHQIALTPSEFKLLMLLARSPHRVVSRQEILGHLFGMNALLPGDSCYTHVWRLRRKIEMQAPNSARIICERGFGYKLVP
jgi:DNA-binding response OmpR family regulator